MQEGEQKNTEISDRINLMIETLGIKANAFALALGYKRSQTVYDVINGKSAPSFDFFNKFANSEYSEIINLHWLLTGKGKLFNPQTTESLATPYNKGKSTKASKDKNTQHPSPGTTYEIQELPVYMETESDAEPAAPSLPSFTVERSGGVQGVGIPLYDLNTTIGLAELFEDASSLTPIDYLSIPGLLCCDGAVYVRGEAMYPLLKSGDIVLYKRVTDLRHIIWGEMYLIAYSMDHDNYTVARFIQKIKGDWTHILLTSSNPNHAPIEVPVDAIRVLAIIKASVRYNTIG